MSTFSFHLQSQRGNARAGVMSTPHGDVPTPIYMPVGTAASVKALDSLDTENTEAPIILANTYHLYLRPGTDVLQKHGGLHAFMKWDKPILTDSGGFQVFSLGKQLENKSPSILSPKGRESQVKPGQRGVKITDQGVTFTSHLDGSKHTFTPEKAIQIQREIGADIIMAFDECTPDQAPVEYARQALDRTHAWAEQCKKYWETNERVNVYDRYQALFGIIQGAMHQELRRESAQKIVDLDFDGIAFGGESIGYNKSATQQVIDWVRDILPEQKPRYAMGLGRDPQDIIDAVLAGYDMFDCVAPTRLARNGSVYFGKIDFDTDKDKPVFVSPYKNGRLQIGNKQWEYDQQVIQEDCDCYTCSHGYTRSYLRHLFKAQELSYYRLASIHNTRYMIRLCEQMREWITNNA